MAIFCELTSDRCGAVTGGQLIRDHHVTGAVSLSVSLPLVRQGYSLFYSLFSMFNVLLSHVTSSSPLSSALYHVFHVDVALVLL